MTTLHSSVSWEGGVAFTATQDGLDFALDAEPALGGRGQGLRPKALLLTAAIGCTGMDVISTLQKMRVPVDTFTVDADGDIADTHPRRYTTVCIRYALTGPPGLSVARVQRAVRLSTEKYCGVIATLRAAMPLSFVIEVNGQRHPLQ